MIKLVGLLFFLSSVCCEALTYKALVVHTPGIFGVIKTFVLSSGLTLFSITMDSCGDLLLLVLLFLSLLSGSGVCGEFFITVLMSVLFMFTIKIDDLESRAFRTFINHHLTPERQSETPSPGPRSLTAAPEPKASVQPQTTAA